MVSQTTAYIVPFTQLKQTAGCKDPKLLPLLLKEYDWMIEEIDGNRKDADTQTCAEALRQLIDGDDLCGVSGWHGYLYGWTMEVLCTHIGEFVSEISGDWGDELDAFFAERDIPLPFSEILWGDTVIDLPSADDCPYIGSWSPAIVKAAAPGVAAIDVVALWVEDKELAEVVAEVKEWVAKAAERRGWGVIGFSF